nr:MFS transporter [Rickettsia endosymbiont of Ceutorhynchus assimilis]
MLSYENEQKSLTKEQKKAVGLLSIGTFLEYFDFMLYVHMAVLLNDLFFPKDSPTSVSFMAAFAFSSTYLLRPFAALIFGWIGDNIGRKATIVITTAIMALSCVIMANVGTYAKIGVISSWVVTFCRVAQGLSSMGEIIGAGIYLTETVKPPLRYPAVASVVIASTLGGTAALAVASLVTSYGFNWRLAFWIGGGIAVIGIIARTTLREAPDFVNAKKKIQDSLARINENITILKDDAIFNEKINKKVLIFYFIMESTSPVYFYLNYIYCGNILKNTFFYTADQVIKQNFILGVANFLNVLILTFLCYKVHPIKILRYKLFIFIPFSIVMPYFLNIATSPSQVLLIQLLSIFFACTAFPANPVIYVYFPIFKRFSAVTFTFAISKAVMYTISSFGIMYLTKYFGNLGLLILILPLNLGYTMAVNYFKNLERMNNNYH